jgi:hypothetical protein
MNRRVQQLVDLRLCQLAEYIAKQRNTARGRTLSRLALGKADRLMLDTYPLNYEMVRADFDKTVRLLKSGTMQFVHSVN